MLKLQNIIQILDTSMRILAGIFIGNMLLSFRPHKRKGSKVIGVAFPKKELNNSRYCFNVQTLKKKKEKRNMKPMFDLVKQSNETSKIRIYKYKDKSNIQRKQI